ncbi:hypothetical protein [Infirmifilum sp. SLHALR2]|nr:MAG: hypothetical protein B7L53_07340 [Thermofilum sp. NZ13]
MRRTALIPALALLLAALVLLALRLTQHSLPEPRRGLDVIGVDAELGSGVVVFRVYARNATPTPYIPLVVETPAGNAQRLSAAYACSYWVARLELRGEGAYRVSVLDPETGSALLTRVLELSDRPAIHSVSVEERAELGLATVTVNASDSSGIAIALIEYKASNHSMVKIQNGLYAYNLSLGDSPETLQAKIYVTDPFGNTASASIAVNWSLEDAFTFYGLENGFSFSQTRQFFNQYKDLIEKSYPVNKLGILAMLHLYVGNSALLDAAKQKVYSDPNVADKAVTLLQLSKALYDLNERSLSDTSLNFLGNLTAVEGNPVSAFGRPALWNVLNLTEGNPIIVTGLSKQQPIVYEETPILVYIVNDNLNDSKEFPYAAWALTKQASAIAKWLKVDYNQYLTVNGTKYSLREIVNKDFSTLANYTRKGKMVLGLKPEELLALIPSDHPSRYVIADYWMRQKVLPQSLFYNVWQESVLGWEKYPDFMPHTNGPYTPTFKVYRPEIALKIATDNLNYFDQGHNSVVDVIKNPDKPLAYGWSAKEWIRNYRHRLLVSEDPKFNYFPNTSPEGEKDITLLLDKGSNIAKINLYIYGKSLSDRVLGPVYERPKPEEQRNDQSILNAYSIGLPQFISDTAYPLSTDRAYWVHGEPSFIILPSDISLLYQRSPDELLLNDKTYTLNFLSTRKPAVIKDKVPYCDIFLPDLSEYVYYKS